MRALRNHKAILWGLPIAWMGVIFYLSAQSTLPEITPGGPDLQAIIGHLVVFAVLGWLWWRALRESGARHPAVWAFALAIAYGATDEFHQKFVPGRTADLMDLTLDAIGAATALAVATALSKGGRRATRAARQAVEAEEQSPR